MRSVKLALAGLALAVGLSGCAVLFPAVFAGAVYDGATTNYVTSGYEALCAYTGGTYDRADRGVCK